MAREKTISFKASADLYHRIKEKARQQDKSVSDVLRDAIIAYLDEPYRLRIAEQAEASYQLIQQSKEQVDRLDKIIELLEKGVRSRSKNPRSS